MSIYDQILGSPWVYDKIRPWVVGGVNYDDIYRWLECAADDVVLDIGCGTGHSMEYLKATQTLFHAYHGFDIDQRAIDKFRQKFDADNIHLYAQICLASDVGRTRPTKALAIGLLHHLKDDEILALLAAVHSTNTVKRMVTLDTVFVSGKWMTNILARLDRGRYVRTISGYNELINKSPFKISMETMHSSGNGVGIYYAMCLIPR